MPTPSNNRPDPPRAPHNPYIFSTCPDEQPQIDLPHPPGDWRPRSPPYENPSDAMEEDGEPSRSTTPMSPPTQSSESQDHDRTESERTVSTPTDTDDVQKPTDTDEEMSVGDVVGGSSGVDAAGGGGAPVGGSAPVQDGVSPRRTVRRPAASGSSRRRPVPDSASAARIEVDQRDGSELTMPGPLWMDDTGLLGMGYELADPRVIPISPPSYLRPGVRFHGTQQSERQRYDVQVEIKHVDLRESFLCGYLRIQGLTEDHPTLTTYFEGEIIGSKYGFKTQHPSWGASDKDDLSHWAKFAAFRPFAKQARKGSQVLIKDVLQRENIFMRWKEHFLVPDHRVRTINGASFEGFYYICFNQVRGEVSGIYFHKNSEKFQQLELKHVENRGCYGAMEFR